MAEKVLVRIDKDILSKFRLILKTSLPEESGSKVEEMKEADLARLATRFSVIWTREHPDLVGAFIEKYAELFA